MSNGKQTSKFLPLKLDEFLSQDEYDTARAILKDFIKDKDKVDKKYQLYKNVEAILAKLPVEE